MANWQGGGRVGLALRSWLGTFVGVAIAMLVCLPVSGQNRKAAAASGLGAAPGDVTRGKYLVESVAMCGQCHTPRDANGALDRSKWLEGASVPWMPAQSQSNWPLLAPRIGGAPPASDADMIKLLTTGVWTSGKRLRFPMMPFRMSEADARAVIAYLKTASAWK